MAPFGIQPQDHRAILVQVIGMAAMWYWPEWCVAMPRWAAPTGRHLHTLVKAQAWMKKPLRQLEQASCYESCTGPTPYLRYNCGPRTVSPTGLTAILV